MPSMIPFDGCTLAPFILSLSRNNIICSNNIALCTSPRHPVITVFSFCILASITLHSWEMTMAAWAQLWGTGLRAFIHLYQLLYQLCWHTQQDNQPLSHQAMVLCSLTFSAPFTQQTLAISPLHSDWYHWNPGPPHLALCSDKYHSSWFSWYKGHSSLTHLVHPYLFNFTQTPTVYSFILFHWFPVSLYFLPKPI